MERILYEQIYQYLSDNSLLTECQYGFRKMHSTVSALLGSTNSWYVNMDRKMFNLVVLLDLKKPFDTIDHSILLSKIDRTLWYNGKCFVNDTLIFIWS